MEKICVLMTSYNPNKYYIEQVGSILSQKDVSVDLVIRDDCSTNTEWLEKTPAANNIMIIRGEKNLGVAQNILALIRYARENRGEYTYYAYSDQDDVWKADKLITGIQALKNMDMSRPCLYYSNLTVVDKDLKGTSLLFKSGVVKSTLPQGMAQIFAFACTFVFNKKMVEAILEKPIEFMGFDHLVYYIALIEGNVCFDDTSHILYRQTGENVSGDKTQGIKRILDRIKNMFNEKEDVARAGGGRFEEIAKYLLRNFGKELTDHDEQLLRTVSDYRLSIRNKWRLIRNSEIKAGYQPKDFYRNMRIVLGKY